MRYLLLVAHGSRREASNDEVRKVTQLMGKMEHDFDVVSCAFLELTTPLIPDSIRHAVAQGANEIVVVPYFLAAGRHVVTDIPEEVDSVTAEFPNVTISIAPYLGIAKSIPAILLAQANNKAGLKN